MHVIVRRQLLTVWRLHVVVVAVVVLVCSFCFRQPSVYLPMRPSSSRIPFAHVHVNPDDEQRDEDHAPSELQVDDRNGVAQAVLAAAAQVDAAAAVEVASGGKHPGDPRDADDDAPEALEREGRGADEAGGELEVRGEAGGAEQRGGEARGGGGLQEPVQAGLDAGVVVGGGGVDVEHEQLLREERRQEEHAERRRRRRRVALATAVVQVYGGAGVDEERGVDDGVLVVRQALRRDGAVGAERHRRVGEHLGGQPVRSRGQHGDGLEAAHPWRREPCCRREDEDDGVGARETKSLMWLKRCHRPRPESIAPARVWLMILSAAPRGSIVMRIDVSRLNC
jgi:hypothetical protein